MVPWGVILFSLYSSIWCARSPTLEKSFNFQIITADENFEKSKCLSCEHKINKPDSSRCSKIATFTVKLYALETEINGIF